MQNVIAIIIVVVLLGGGYYFFTQPGTQSEEGDIVAEEGHSGDTMMEDDAMKEGGEKTKGDTTMEEDGEAMEEGAMKENDGAMMEEGNVVSFTVEGQNFSFVPNSMKVEKGDTVRVTFKNVGGFHDFVIDEFKVATKQINTDQEEAVEFVADKTGSFEFYCSVGNHRAQGMFGTLTVE